MEFKIYDLNGKKSSVQFWNIENDSQHVRESCYSYKTSKTCGKKKALFWFELKWLRSAVLNTSFCCLHFIISCKRKKCAPPASDHPSPDTNLVVLHVLCCVYVRRRRTNSFPLGKSRNVSARVWALVPPSSGSFLPMPAPFLHKDRGIYAHRSVQLPNNYIATQSKWVVGGSRIKKNRPQWSQRL